MGEAVYKGLTRPAMALGVPITPLFVVLAVIALLAVWFQILILSAAIPAIFIMKEISKRDDFIFRLLFLNARFWTNPVSRKFYSNQKTYIASQYDKVNPNFNAPKLSILALSSVPNFKKLLPYDALLSDMVITKNFDLLATWEIVGVPFEVENDEILEHQKNMINMLFRQFDNKNVSFYTHSVRHNITDKFESSKFPNEFLKELDQAYFNGFGDGDLKQNRYFLTAIYSPLTTKAMRSSFKKNKLDKRIKEMNGYVKIFRDYCESIATILSDFTAKRLKSYEIGGIKYSEQLEFYNFLISGKFQKVKTPCAPIDEYLNGNLDSIMFATSTMQLNFADGSKRFCKAIEIKDYPNSSFAGVFDSLMYENIEYTIAQSFVPMPKSDAKTHIERQQKRLNSAEDDAVTQIMELDEALNDLIGGEYIFGNYHFSIIVYGDTVKEVEKNANTITSVLGNNLGFLMSFASIALPATYFSQFPANFDIRPRIHAISSKNYASFVGFHSFLKGMRNGNVWGEAVTILKTPNKQPYYFNWHNTSGNDFSSEKTQLGNSVILGVSRGGKSVLMNFLLDQMIKYTSKDSFPPNTPQDKKKATFFYLDKDKSAIANIFAIGGKYIEIDAGKPTGFNPFQIDNTPENVRRLQTLVKMLVTRNNEILSTYEEEKLNSAIVSIMNDIPKQARQYGISILFDMLTENVKEKNSLKSRLKLWTHGNKFGWVFDNQIDEFRFDDENISVYGIDGTDLLQDEEINSVVSYYILWRINDLCDGRRFAIFIDEAWDWIRNPVVAEYVYNQEKTIAKKNGFICLATQSIDELVKIKISRAIVEQSATVIFLANPAGKWEEYQSLGVSEEEFEFVKHTGILERRFLIRKSGDQKAIASLDFKSLGNVNLAILSTAKAFVDSLEAIIYDKTKTYDEKLKLIKNFYTKDRK